MPEPQMMTHPQVRELLSPFTHSRTVMIWKMQDIDNTIISVIVNYIRYTL